MLGCKKKLWLRFTQLLRDQCVCLHTYVSFHQNLAFCFGDYMHQGTNDRNITISRRDYREDDRRGE